MKKTKILHISETFVGGVYTYIKQLSNYSEKNNLKTFIIHGGKRVEENNEVITNDFSQNIEFIKIEMTREISIFKDIKALLKIVSEIHRIKPDVIHVHSSKAGVLGRIARIFYPKSKLFYTPHGYSFIREDISTSKKLLFKFLEKIITFVFRGTIVACGDQEYIEAQKMGTAKLIRNGVFIDEILKNKAPFNNQKLTIGTSGSIYAPKNPELFNQIAIRLPEYDFVWIGDGELKHKLTAKNITITGWNSRTETLKAVNNLDLFLSTSLWEGLPFSIIEALSLSKPIISSNIKGNKITVNHNINGFICTTEDLFVSAIKTLENKTAREQFGNESFKLANEHFNLEKNFVDLIKMYTK